MKYGRHPQKFDNPEPNLQQQWLDLKEVLCDNEYMMGYKIMVGQPITPRTVLNILTTVHTDTTNIWTHIIGAIFLFHCGATSVFPVSIVAISAAVTCCLSAFYHTFRNYSRKLFDICLCLDVSSIGIQVFGSFFADVIILFGPSHPATARRFAIFGVVLCTVTLASIPFILRRKLYWVRTFVFTCESLLGVPVFAQKYLLDGLNEKMISAITWRALCLTIGAVAISVRSAHVPERFFPKTVFQYVFHSHCFFHILSTVGGYMVIRSAQAEL
jgi:predicted membrane channel-forming protein YqfA (hemolysin III family)